MSGAGGSVRTRGGHDGLRPGRLSSEPREAGAGPVAPRGVDRRPGPQRRRAVTDFASAAMIRVLSQGMRERGLDPGRLAHDAGEARVALRLKQGLVRAAVEQGGLGCLPLLGRGLRRLTHEPTHQALASARDAHDLFERWQRLERYIHSRHRCVVESCGAEEARLRHVSIMRGAAPSAAEDLVVAGVLAALLEAIGLQQVRVWTGGAMAYPDPHGPDLQQAAASGTTSSWRIRWEGTGGRVPVVPAEGPALQTGADPAWPEVARAAYRRIARDLTRPVALRELAVDLDLPWRTLQRRLREAGLSYSRLLAEARCRNGAWRLLHTADPIAEIGFLSGFSDQSHFTREMQRRVGMPPAAYRAAFASVGNRARRRGA